MKRKWPKSHSHSVRYCALITLCVVSLAFWMFHLRFGFFVAFSLARKTQENLSILHYALGKNASQLRFFSRFGTFEVSKTQTHHIV